MNLSTVVDIRALKPKLTYNDKIMFIGSCFAESVGRMFDQSKFATCINPFGTIFNPTSVANSLLLLTNAEKVDQSDFFYHNHRWSSFMHHGSFSENTKEQLLSNVENANIVGSTFLANCNLLCITWGTAWVFRHNQTGQIVANCHKLPAASFTRFRLDVDQIVAQYAALLPLLQKNNPNLKIVLTVSPVRHIGDGLHGNQLSKSTLLLAAEKLCEQFDFVSYFPSYEIMLDELRDYRFFAQDMVHPSALAVQYIWERITEQWMDLETHNVLRKIEKLNAAISHKPFNPNSDMHQQFLSKLLADIDGLAKQYAAIDFANEISQIEKSMKINIL